jgi:hypothetical protein
MQSLTDVYRRANDDCWATQRCEARETEFETTLRIPDEAQGPCAVRVFVEGAKSSALGAAVLYVTAPER